MTRHLTLFAVALLCALGAVAEPIRALVVTGDHPYDTNTFPGIFKEYDDIVWDHVELRDQSELFEQTADWDHDVIVLYNMSQAISETRRENYIGLLERGVGLVVLHHGLLNYMDWPEADAIYGRSLNFGGPWGFHLDQRFTVRVADPAHPITEGMADFEAHDETYTRYTDPAMPGSHVLLSTDHQPGDPAIAWVRQYANARVFALQLGHDAPTFTDPNYHRLVAQGVRWAAGRLPDSAGGEALADTTLFRLNNLPWAFGKLAHYAFGEVRTAPALVEQTVSAALGDPVRTEELARRLETVLNRDDCAPGGRDVAFRQLELLRSPASADAVAAWLIDPAWSHRARRVLENLPGDRAGNVLRDALGKTGGSVQAGIAASLGARRDPKAVRPLARLARSEDTTVAAAALDALALTGTKPAAKALGRARVRIDLERCRQEALVRCAERLLSDGDRDTALAAALAVHDQRADEAVQAQTLSVILRCEPESASARMADALRQGPPLSDTAVAAVRELDAPGLVDTVAGVLGDLEPITRAQAVIALGERGDAVARDAVASLLTADEPAVRVAATRALATLGDASVAPALCDRAADPGEEGEAARRALAVLPDPAIGRIVLDKARQADPSHGAVLLGLLAARRDETLFGEVAVLTGGDDTELDIAAWNALGLLAGRDTFAAMAEMLSRAPVRSLPDAGAAVATAVRRLDNRDGAAGILRGAYAPAPSANKAALLRVMAGIPLDETLDFISAALLSSDPSVSDAAVSALAQWPDDRAVPALMRVARTAAEPGRRDIVALGMARIAGSDPTRPAPEALALYNEALRAAASGDAASGVLREMATLSDIGALRLALTSLRRDDTRRDAAQSALALARALGPDYPEEAGKALDAVLDATADEFVTAQAGTVRQELAALTERLVKQWTFAEGTEGWEALNHCEIRADDGILHLTSTGVDPFIQTDTSFPGGKLDITIRMRTNMPGPLQIFWGTDIKPVFGEPGTFTVLGMPRDDGEWHEYSVPAEIEGTITTFRIDPSMRTGEAAIDWIRILRAE